MKKHLRRHSRKNLKRHFENRFQLAAESKNLNRHFENRVQLAADLIGLLHSWSDSQNYCLMDSLTDSRKGWRLNILARWAASYGCIAMSILAGRLMDSPKRSRKG